jgi:hypothetical protein
MQQLSEQSHRRDLPIDSEVLRFGIALISTHPSQSAKLL